MSKLVDKKINRNKFGWRDGVALGIIAAVIAGIFTWSYLAIDTSLSNEAKLFIRYKNKVVSDNLRLTSSNGYKYTYSISFRRELKGEENYTDNSYERFNLNLTNENYTLEKLSNVSDFSSLDGKYLIVKDDENKFDKFQEFYGPQVDVVIFNGGFQVSKEDSPEHICSNQGFQNLANFPVVCLPNSMYFWVINNQAGGPDA